MAQVKSPAEHMLHATSASPQATNVADPTGPSIGLSIFQQPKFLLAFFVVLSFVVARIFGAQKQKRLPPGVKPLPRLPGMFAPDPTFTLPNH
jgi:hypothetical protein